MDASKNIEAFLRYASKSLKRPAEPRRGEEKRRNHQRNRPFNKAVPLGNIKPANMTASYEMYKQKSSDIRPASRIMRQWDAPVALRPPSDINGMQSLQKLSNEHKQHKFKKPHPPSKLKQSKKVRNKRTSSNANTEVSRGNKFVSGMENANIAMEHYSPSERIGTNYSLSTLCLSLKLIGDLNSVRENETEYKLKIENRWKSLRASYIKESKLFLKIDTSKLPLWSFDTPTESNNDIQTSIKNKATYAYAKYYNGKIFNWEKCKILNYDPMTNKYRIKFVKSKTEKMLRSMFISFADHETILDTEKRILTAKEEREHTKLVLRFLHFVDMQEDSIASCPPSNLEKEILIKLNFVPCKESTEIKALLHEFRDTYSTGQKRATAIYRLMNPLNDPLRHLLKLPGPSELMANYAFGCSAKSFLRASCIRGKDFGGKDVSARLRSTALFIKKGTINAMLKTSWAWYPHFSLVDLFETEAFERKLGITNIEKVPIAAIHLAEEPEGGDEVTKKQHKASLNHIFRRKPLFIMRNKIRNAMITLDEFTELQRHHIEAVVKQMEKIWIKVIISSLQRLHNSKQGFDIYTTKLELLDARFLGVMKAIQLRMSNEIKRLILRSFQSIINFVEISALTKDAEERVSNDFKRRSIRYVLNHELDNEIETTFAMPLLLTINSENLKNDSVRNVTAATVSHDTKYNDSKRTVTKVQSFYSPPIQALLTINMEIDMSSAKSNFIVYNPPLENIEAAFMTFLGFGFNRCKSIEPPMHFILQFIDFKNENSIFGEFQNILDKQHHYTRTKVQNLLHNQFNQMAKLVELYQEFSSILKINNTSLTKYIFSQCSDGYQEKVVVNDRNLGEDEEEGDVFEGYTGGSGPSTVQDEIRRFSMIRDEIMLKTFNDEYIGMFSLNFQNVKTAIAEKANDIVKCLSEQVIANVTKKYLDLLTEYSIISDKLTSAIENEKDIFEMRNFLNELPIMIIDLKKRHSILSDRIKCLGEFFVNETYECFEMSWNLYQWPSKIEKIKDACSFRVMTVSRKLQQIISSEEKMLNNQVMKIKSAVIGFKKVGDSNRIDYFAGEAAALHGHLENIHDKAVELNEREENLDSTLTEFMELERLMKEFSPIFQLWTTYSDSISDISNWKTCSFWDLDKIEVVNKIENWKHGSSNLISYFKKERIRDPCKIAENFEEHVFAFNTYLEVIKTLKNPALETRHWKEISKILQFEIRPGVEVSISTIIEHEGYNKIEDLESVILKAEKERKYEEQFEKIKEQWISATATIEFIESCDLHILTSFNEIFSLTDDMILKIENILSTRYATSVSTQAQEVLKDIRLLQEIFRICRTFQEKAVPLYSLFQVEDIRSILAPEARKFSAMVVIWRRFGLDIKRKPTLDSICEMPNILDNLKTWLELTDHVNYKKVSYLNSKRKLCSRLYLLGDDDIVRMLHFTNHIQNVENCIHKCFPGIRSFNKLMISTHLKDNDSVEVKQNNSTESEKSTSWHIVLLNGYGADTLQLTNSVETGLNIFPEWLDNLLHETQNSLRNQIFDLKTSIEERISETSLQVSQVQEEILWNQMVQEKIESGKLESISRYVDDDIKILVDLVQNMSLNVNSTHRKIHAILSWKFNARDIAKQLQFFKVSSVGDYEWSKYPRYSVHKKLDSDTEELATSLSVAVIEGRIQYGNEFLNSESSITMTALGNRYIKVLLSSYLCSYGNRLDGESLRDARCLFHAAATSLGKSSFLFKCQPETDISSMLGFIRGIARSALWGGFEGLHKLHIQYASMILLEMNQILLVRRENRKTFKDYEISSTFHLCLIQGITNSKNLKWYGHCTENFRNVRLSLPDYEVIVELYLSVFSFPHSTLSLNIKKFFAVYDNNMVLNATFAFQKSTLYSKIISSIIQHSTKPETANINYIVAKMLYETLFASFSKKNRVELKQNLEKVFAVNLSLKNLRNVGARLLDIFKDSDLVPFSQLLDNIKILDSAMQLSKRPVLVYGGASSGKSTITKVACMDKQKSIFHLYVSAMKFDKLIGTYVGSSNTWQDGILPMMIRTHRLDSKNVVLFDVANGTDFPDVALNGIDENAHHTAYQICLPTGERLDVSSNVIIESYQISCFSPRDLSNLSLIYCSNVDGFWYGICASWLSMHKEKYKWLPEFETFVSKLIAWLFPSMIANFRCSKLPHQEVYATLEIFSGLLEQIDTLELTNPNLKKGGKKKTAKAHVKQKASDKCETIVEAMFIWAVIWGFGGKYEDKNVKLHFEKTLRDILDGVSSGGFDEGQFSGTDFGQFENLPYIDCQNPIRQKSKLLLPSQTSLFDIVYSVEKNKWVSARDKSLEISKAGGTAFFSNLIIHNSYFILQKLIPTEKNIYIAGGEKNDRLAWLQNLTGNAKYKDTFAYCPSHLKHDFEYFDTFLRDQIFSYGNSLCKPKKSQQLKVVVEDMSVCEGDDAMTCIIETMRQVQHSKQLFNSDSESHTRIEGISFMSTVDVKQLDTPTITRLIGRSIVINLPSFTAEHLVKVMSRSFTGRLDNRTVKSICNVTTELFNTICVAASLDQEPMPSLFQLRHVAATISKLIGNINTSVSSHIWEVWSHACVRVFRDSMRNAFLFDNSLHKLIQKHSLPLSKKKFFVDNYGFFTTLGLSRDKFSPIHEEEFLNIVEDIEIRLENCGNAHFPILKKKKSCLSDVAHLSHVIHDHEEDVIYVGSSSLEKTYTISLLAKVTSNTMILASSMKAIIEIVRKNIKKKERTLIVFKPENTNEVESTIIKLSNKYQFRKTALRFCGKESIADEMLNCWSRDFRILYSVESGNFTNSSIRRHFRIVFACAAQEQDFSREFPASYHPHTFVSNHRSNFDNIFLAVMHEVDKESHRRTTSGPLRYYEFVDEYNRIARFYETFAAMNYDKVSRILGNIDLIKDEFSKTKTKQRLLEERFDFYSKQRAAAATEIEKINSEKSIILKNIADIKKRLDVHKNQSDDLTTQYHAIMDPMVTQLEHINIEFSATSHKDEISALKKLEKPSPQIVLVVEALCILFGIRPQKSKGDSITSVDYFEAARKHIFNNSANLLQRILNFDRNSITENVFSILLQFHAKKQFAPKAVKRQSKFCALLCKWIRVIIDFTKAMKSASPINRELRDASHNIQMAHVDLNEMKNSLQSLDEQCNNLHMQLEESKQRENSAELKLSKVKSNAQNSKLILQVLQPFQSRYVEELEMLDEVQMNARGNAVFVATFTTYCNLLGDEERADLLSTVTNICQKKQVSMSTNVDMGLLIDAENMDYVSREVRIHKCRRISAQSNLLLQEATHLVLLVDPFQVAAKLLATLFTNGKAVDVISVHHEDCKKEIDDSSKNSPLIVQIENIENDVDVITRYLGTASSGSGGPSQKTTRKIFLSSSQHDIILPRYLFGKISVVNLVNPEITKSFLLDSILDLDPALKKHYLTLIDEEEISFRRKKELDVKLMELLQRRSLDGIYDRADEIQKYAMEWREQDELYERSKRQLEIVKEDVILWSPLVDVINATARFSKKAHSYDPAYKHNFHTIMCLFHESMKQIKKQRHTTLLAQRIKGILISKIYRYIFPSFKIRDVLPMTFLFFWELENKRTRSDFLKTVFSNFLSGNENKKRKDLDRSADSVASIAWLPPSARSRLQELNNCPEFIGVTNALLRHPIQFYDLMNSTLSDEDFEKNYFFEDKLNENSEKLKDGQHAELRLVHRMGMQYLFEGLNNKTIKLLQDWVVNMCGSCSPYEPDQDTIENTIVYGTNRKPVLIVGNKKRNLIAKLRSIAATKNMLRKLRIFSHTTASADAIGDDIKTGMDRGNWIVLTNVDFETEAFWKYYQLCCSVNDSRVDSAFRLIILHKARSFLPHEVAEKCILHRCTYTFGMRDYVLHLFKLIRSSLYDIEIPTDTLEEKNNVLKTIKLMKRSIFCLAFFHATVESKLVLGTKHYSSVISDDLFLASQEVLVRIVMHHRGEDINSYLKSSIVDSLYQETLESVGEASQQNVEILNITYKKIFVDCDRIKSKFIDKDDHSSAFVCDGKLSDAIKELKESQRKFQEPSENFRYFLQGYTKQVEAESLSKLMHLL